MARSERFLLTVTVTAALILRALAFIRYRIDSDEPQHLHVAWGWTAGLLQYRDLFDNHTPLFHMLSAPLLALLGERADVLLWMRGAMVPLFLMVVGATFVIGRRLYSTNVGLWAAVLLTLFPPFFLKSLEYRTDNLWIALWMIVLVVVVARPFTTERAFLTGLLLGTALAVSMKTVLLAIALFGATALRRILQRDRAPVVGPLTATIAGFLIVPGALAAYFLAQGALDDLAYCVVTFNRPVDAGGMAMWLGRLLFPVFLFGIVLVARRYRETAPARLFCALTAALYATTAVSFWILPRVSPRDLLPVMPLLAIFAAAAIGHRLLVYAALMIAFLVSLFYYADRFENRTDEYTTMMNQVLGLTQPGEMLMDIKGETVYRRRPVSWAFEAITREKIRRGLIPDHGPEAIVAARCYVSQAYGPMYPPRTNQFVHDYFVDVGRLRAAGQWIADDGSFTIAVPGPYRILNENGEARGTLDGVSYSGPRQLDAGRHQFERARPGERIVAVWARAFERGYSPFHLRDREF